MAEINEYPISERRSVDDPTTIQNYAQLWADAIYGGQVGPDVAAGDCLGTVQAVALLTMLERYIQNCILELSGTTKIKVEYEADRPPSLVVNSFQLQATALVESAVHSGGAETIYVFANRTAASTTFTITLSASSVEGDDQRLIGQCDWDGAAFDVDTLLSYETENVAGLKTTDDEIIKAWVHFASATGAISDSYNVTSVVRDGVGDYTITWDDDFGDTNYAVVMSGQDTTGYTGTVDTKAVGSIGIETYNAAGSKVDGDFVSILTIGAQ